LKREGFKRGALLLVEAEDDISPAVARGDGCDAPGLKQRRLFQLQPRLHVAQLRLAASKSTVSIYICADPQ
jgi:hypothetical protein